MPTAQPHRILVVDDDQQQRDLVATIVAARGYSAETAVDGEEALEKIGQETHFNAIVTDLAMPRVDGLRLLMTLIERGETTPAIVLTGLTDIGHAVSVVRDLRAFWYLQKPVDPRILGILLERAVNYDKLLSETELLRRQVSSAGSLEQLVGQSSAIQHVFALIQQVAPTAAQVLITGESGTGKELAARAIHRLSPRAGQPFVVINCAALPDTLIESEMFGHERGAFTGAMGRRQGCFEQAHGGTLFLDEITEMNAPAQAKLLRVLQDGGVRRLGGTAEIPVDVRLIAATNRSPEDAVRDNRLREDIYYRLNVFGIQMPALRRRKEDIPALTDALIRTFNETHECSVTGIEPRALQKLMKHSWPGNVRELRNIVERGVIMAREGTLCIEHLPPQLGVELPKVSTPGEFTFRPGATLRQVEQAYVEYTLAQTGVNRRRAAKSLDISERTLYNRLEKAGDNRPDSAQPE